MQLHLAGSGAGGLEFKHATVRFWKHFGDPIRFGPDTGEFTRDPGLPASPGIVPFLLGCQLVAVNGAWTEPLYSLRKGDPVEFVGRVGLPRHSGERLWMDLSSPAREHYYLPATRVPGDQFGPGSFRAAGSTANLPAGDYRFSLIQMDGSEPAACAEFWNLTITDHDR